MDNQNLFPLGEEFLGSIMQLEYLKESAYRLCNAEFEAIISNRLTNEDSIDALFDQLLCFIEDDCFRELYWKLVNYVETFDSGLGANYRRIEEVYFEGY